MGILEFDDSFLSVLKSSIEEKLHKEAKLGKPFRSADSFAYLIEIEERKYVAKIYRFEDWPPIGKLPAVEELLDSHNIPHEKYLFVENTHPVFKYGWSLSEFIPGGSIRELRENGTMDEEAYYRKIGIILRSIHSIPLQKYGAILKDGASFKTFPEYVLNDVKEQDYQNLQSLFPNSYSILEEAKIWVLENLNTFQWNPPVLVHDDVSDGNVIWNNGNIVLIDWTDTLASVPVRDFTTLTIREDRAILNLIEKGYGVPINQDELRFHQIMRFIRWGRFYFVEEKNLPELKQMTSRLEILMKRKQPFGC